MNKAGVEAEFPDVFPWSVVVSADVLKATCLRDIIFHLAERDLLSVHWTRAVEKEWAGAMASEYAEGRSLIADCLNGMREAAPGWEISGYEKYTKFFKDVLPERRHIAAAAHTLSLEHSFNQRVALLTCDMEGLPLNAFANTPVSPFHAVDLLYAVYQKKPSLVLKIVDKCRAMVRTPVLTREEYIGILVKNGGLKFSRAIAVYWNVECPAVDETGNLYYKSDHRGSVKKK